MRDIHRNSTVGDVVAHDVRTADVFSRYEIDFCCGGRSTIEEACAGTDLDVDIVVNELRKVSAEPDPGVDVTTWSASRLIDRIVTRHHRYIRSHAPVITDHLARLADKHAERRPEIARLCAIFGDVRDELIHHMEREERIVFPVIARLADGLPSASAGEFGIDVEQAIAVMEDEHDWVASQLGHMRALAGDYTVPSDGCATWRACYTALEQFENDLHEHVHLENNVLFPLATRLAHGKPIS